MTGLIIPVGAGEDGVEETGDLRSRRDGGRLLLLGLFEIAVDLESARFGASDERTA